MIFSWDGQGLLRSPVSIILLKVCSLNSYRMPECQDLEFKRYLRLTYHCLALLDALVNRGLIFHCYQHGTKYMVYLSFLIVVAGLTEAGAMKEQRGQYLCRG